jgi:hypothetical protein
MKASKVVVLALILAFLLAAVSVTPSAAWDKSGSSGIVPPPPPDPGGPKPITEGDPWDDDDGGGPDGSNVGHGVIIITPSNLPGWITKLTVIYYQMKAPMVPTIGRKVVKNRVTISK